MIRTFLTCLCLIVVAAPVVAMESIAVVVNDDAISMTDVNDRLRLIMVSSGLPDNNEVKKRLMPQIISGLIDEQLMLQAARKEQIAVTEEQVQGGFEQLAAQNKTTADDFKKMLSQGKINPATLERQISAQISWSMVVQKKFRPQVNINDNDIDDFIDRIKADAGQEEFFVSEILLPIEGDIKESDVKKLATNVIQQIQQGKAPFGRMAQQFSKAPGAQQGGGLGWIKAGQLSSELNNVLVTMDQGQISSPIRTPEGYHILFVQSKRTITEKAIPEREQVRSIIGTKRLERMQARHLMDLKAAAFIENRV